MRQRVHCGPSWLRSPPAPECLLSSCAASVEDEFLAPRFVHRERRLLRFFEDKPFEDKDVHIRPHEATVSVFGRTHNRLTSDVERGVHNDRTTGSTVESLDDVVVGRMCIATYCL